MGPTVTLHHANDAGNTARATPTAIKGIDIQIRSMCFGRRAGAGTSLPRSLTSFALFGAWLPVHSAGAVFASAAHHLPAPVNMGGNRRRPR